MRRITQCMYRSKCTRKTNIQCREEQVAAAASRKQSHYVARSRFAARTSRDDGREDLNGGKALPSVGKQPCLVGTPPPRKQQQQQRERERTMVVRREQEVRKAQAKAADMQSRNMPPCNMRTHKHASHMRYTLHVHTNMMLKSKYAIMQHERTNMTTIWSTHSIHTQHDAEAKKPAHMRMPIIVSHLLQKTQMSGTCTCAEVRASSRHRAFCCDSSFLVGVC